MSGGSRRGGRAAAAAVAALVALAAPAGAQAPPRHLDPAFLASIDDARLHGTITPPGADSHHATTEVAAYDDLVQGYPTLTDRELRTRYFKTRIFGPLTDVGRTYKPRAGVTVVRDGKWGEPHIYGNTDEDMAFGAGYVTAEDRLALMELMRALGRSEAFELVGTAPAWLADAQAARLYGYTEEELQAQIDRLPAVYGQPGRDFVKILDGYVAGINEYIAAAARGEVPIPSGFADLGLKAPAPWKGTDVVAAVSTVRALFGAGGGSELENASVLAGLLKDFGPAKGRAIYEDFRNRDNRDGPVHTLRRFPYMPRDERRLDGAATALGFSTRSRPSAAQVREVSALAEQARIKWERLKLSIPLGALDLSKPNSMSNHLVVGPTRSASGHPLLLGGPQAGYFSPEILLDYELHSPTIHARGAGFPGLSTLVILGRTQNYAWTPTAGGSDMIDTYVEELCEPGGAATKDSRWYRFRGDCRPMDRRTLRQSQSPALPDIVVERTIHGPVVARGMLGGRPVAVTRKRSTYMKELDAAISILKMNRNEARTGKKFVDIFHESHNLSTNWSYANDREIAYVHGGLYPRRPVQADPDLPVWGTGRWEWQADARGNDLYLGRDEVPNEVSPRRDFFVSWNNSQAPGWSASDAQWGHSSLHRGKLLEDEIVSERRPITPVRLVQMMERAGLTDLRGRYVAPVALRVLERAPGIGPREQRMIALLRQWIAEGALRRDGNGDGDYDRAAAVAIMDAWWAPLIHAIYDPVIGDPARIPLQFDNAPGPTGSAYESGFYGQVWTDLSMVLGHRLRSPTSRVYCGGSAAASGKLPECAARLLGSLRAAGDALAAGQRTDDPGAWKADAVAERIRFLPGAAISMHWVNRPTTQQIAMFGAHTPACALASAFDAAGARPSGTGIAVVLRGATVAPATVDIRRVATPSLPTRWRLVRRYSGLRAGVRWNGRGRGTGDGWYVVSLRGRARDGSSDVRRFALRRVRGRFAAVPALERRSVCATVRGASVSSPAFGARGFGVAFRLGQARTVSVDVLRGRRVVRRFAPRAYAAGLHRLAVPGRGLGPGAYRVVVRAAGERPVTLGARRL